MARILVVEDDSEILELMTSLLETAGHHVSYARNGNEGLSLYQVDEVDLVITDIMMPEKDGVETIRELKRRNDAVKIIAITGYRGRFNRLPAAEFLGAQETILKPFTKADLLYTVDKLLSINPRPSV
ncbi:MAG: response regulator [bacterium]|nr:response regulator [bacterium]